MNANIHVVAQTLNIASPTNSSQTILSITFPEQYISINSGANVLNFQISTNTGAITSNINSIPSVHVNSVSYNVSSNSYSLSLIRDSDGFVYSFNTIAYLIDQIQQAIANGNTVVLNTLLSELAAARLQNQATFGATIDSVNISANAQTYLDWFNAEFAKPKTSFVAKFFDPAISTDHKLAWTTIVTNADDQFRQRLAWIWSQIFVTASNDDQGFTPWVYYYEMLLDNVFNNFQTFLYNLSTNYKMGTYLNMFKSAAAGSAANPTGEADENYAREIQQLFSIGLVKLNQDGSMQLDANNNPIPTYDQTEIKQMAKVFTGWGSNANAHTFGIDSWNYDNDYTAPMLPYDTLGYHDTTQKTILDGNVLPAGQNANTDLNQTLTIICNHQNVGPFMGKQLIQKMVTSNPSPAYISNVSATWANDGQGVRGNLKAVYISILTDPEALLTVNNTTYGKMREPYIRNIHLWRAFKANNLITSSNTYTYQLYVYNPDERFGFGQAPGYSPSVFNFYTSFYTKAGPIASSNLVAPEFQITNEYTTAATFGYFGQAGTFWINSKGQSSALFGQYTSSLYGNNFPILRTSQWETLAANSNTTNIVDTMNVIFMHGTMSSNMRNALINYIATQNVANTWTLATDVATLIINSPEYTIQR